MSNETNTTDESTIDPAILKALGRGELDQLDKVVAKEPEIKVEIADEIKAPSTMTPEQAAKFAETRRAQLTQILTQGRVNARIQQIMDKLPKDRFGVFVRNADTDIEHYQQLGFEIELGLNVKGIHGSGDNRVIIGDVVLMTTSQDNIAVIRQIEEDMLRDKLDLPRREYLAVSANNGGVAVFDETEKR